ncbi:hypothetical protein EJA01_17795 [Rhodovulum iodosum]|uniref:hypothetical protein n=1 Tax=Rhodovulum iodosum TaxID=68291 RepID=UPI000F66E675|nr:hypothetical protein [Rhodovulum robiginosum]RSK30619.1 hypothetical protein EJA01_17795 [Rhodovulum robiginosum]
MLTGTAFVHAHWMLPLFMLAAPPVMMWALRQARARAYRFTDSETRIVRFLLFDFGPGAE